MKSESEVAQSCPTLSDPMHCSLPGSSVHGIFQARVLEWGAIAFSDEDLQNLLKLTPKKDALFIIRDWNAKVGSQETPGLIGKFGLGVQNEAGQSLIEFCQENALVIANTLFQQHKRRLYTRTSPMVNTEIRLIIFFAAKDGEALYSQQKQDRDLAQIMNSLLPNSDFS